MMIRTTLNLPEPLHQQLTLLSKRRGQSFAELARRLFAQALTEDDSQDVLATYQALDELRGMGDAGVTDASSTIDAVLYGENGAWRGDPDDDGTGQQTLALPERPA